MRRPAAGLSDNFDHGSSEQVALATPVQVEHEMPFSRIAHARAQHSKI
jgi:hypothetical protein